MPVIQKEISVPANGTIENALSGSAFEFARSNQLVSGGVTAAAAGLFVTVQSGADIVLEESPAAIKASFPIIPDDMYYNDVATLGDRHVVRIRNSTGAIVVARVLVQITAI